MEMEHHFFILMCLISVLKIKIERERSVQTIIFCVCYLSVQMGGDCGTSPTIVPVLILHLATKKVQKTSVDK